MTPFVILMGNLGYLRGINGCLAHHVRYAHRYFYCPPSVQEACIRQVVGIMAREQPDLCCFVEIDKGSTGLANFNQLEKLVSERYRFFDIENKYGPLSRLRSLPLMRGKSNGFLATRKLPYEKIHFTHGTKKLIYKILIEPGITLFFAHFSLIANVRAQQLLQMRELVRETPGEIILMGDFNTHNGFGELAPLLHENNLVLLNKEDEPTFRFHNFRLPLDLCICSQAVAGRAELKVVPQPYSDHEALLLTLH
ncbi:MAG: endonuclease/exonuclease/phosphatase family protein [Alphaproteobacteria bacterium]|nr:endonuclease/exonuclease/phosphatase family protein [Alphaproteobacteria bacterium]